MSCTDKHFWEKFLKLYRSLPTLWRVKSPDYTDGKARAAAYDKLVAKLRERYPNANREFARKKINNFRTNYKKNLKKVMNEELNEAKLWYFPLMTFLENQDAPVIPYDENEPSIIPEQDFSIYEESKPWKYYTECVQQRTPTITEETVHTTGTLNEKRVSKKPILYGETAPLRCAKIAKESNSPPEKKRKISDEDPLKRSSGEQIPAESSEALYTRVWAAELKEMEPIQCKLAKKIISDVLFHSSIGKVQSSHVVEIQNMLNRHTHESSASSSVGYEEGSDS